MKANLRIYSYLAIVLGCLVPFGHFVLTDATFIGDSDRLNAFLNIRKCELDSLHQYGYVVAWNERMFMGNGTSGLHYMLPGAGAFAYLEYWFPLESLFRAMTFVTLFLVVCVGLGAFVFLRDISRNDFTAVVGAILYCLSAYVIHRSAQLDASLGVLIQIPLGMLAIRRTTPTFLAVPLAGLALIATSLLMFTFLQEAAYALVLFGMYAFHRAVIQRSHWPISVLALACGLATVTAGPRVFTVLEDFSELARTKDFQQTSWIEIYRFYSEGVFGRYQGEGRSIGNGTNLHEGLQLVGSSLAALVVVAGALSARRIPERLAAFSLLVVLSMVLGGPMYRVYTYIQGRVGAFSTEFWILVVNFIVGLGCVVVVYLAKLKRARHVSGGKRTLDSGEDAGREFLFCTLTLATVLCVVLVKEARWLFYMLFLKVDFTHARFSIAGLLPFCCLVTLWLTRLMRTSTGALPPIDLRLASGAVACGAALAWVVEGVPGEMLVRLLDVGPIHVAWNRVLPLEGIRLFLWAAIFATVLLVLSRRSRRRETWRIVVAVIIGSAISLETIFFAQFKLAGPQTRAHAKPFESNNYMNAASGDLRPPRISAQSEIRRELESDRFRAVFMAPRSQYPAFVAPHLANFWGLRAVDGYSAGVPWRLAAFDWPGDVRTLRSIAFGSAAQVPWELLGYMNVKYGVEVNDEFYYNRGSVCFDADTTCIPRPRLVKNPYEPLPRHFLVGRAEPGGMPFATRAEGGLSAPRAVVASALEGGDISVSWNSPWRTDQSFSVELADRESSWRVSGQVGPGSRMHLQKGLRPGATYAFRVRSCRKDGCSEYSDPVLVSTPVPGIRVPSELGIERLDSSLVRLSWKGDTSPDIRYVVERQGGPNAQYVEYAAVHGVTSVVIPNGPRGQADTFRVRSCTAARCSAHSDTTSVAEALQVGNTSTSTPLPLDLRKVSYVEGIENSRTFDETGSLDVRYAGDKIEVLVGVSKKERLVVMNEMYHPRWKAFAGNRELKVLPTNTVMRGIVVAPGVTQVTLKFVPFLHTPIGLTIMAGGLLLGVSAFKWILSVQRRSQG